MVWICLKNHDRNGYHARRDTGAPNPESVLAVVIVLMAQCTMAAEPGGVLSPPSPKQQLAVVRQTITRVSVLPESVNGAAGQFATIRYVLSAPGDVTIRVYGPNQEFVREVVAGAARNAGSSEEVWDGRTGDGRLVPDEAYIVLVEARSGGKTDVYNPLTVSGGELVTPQEFRSRPDRGTVEYVLPKPCRVRIRAGLEEGPMLNTIVNWEPRAAGLCTEVWRGRDRQGVYEFVRRPDSFVTISAYALPENSVITVGNRNITYRDWYLKEGHKLSRKPKVERSPEHPGVMSPHWEVPPHLDIDPEVVVSFPELKQATTSPATEPAVRATDPQPPGTQPAPPSPLLPPPPPLATRPIVRQYGAVTPVVLEGDSALLRVTMPDAASLAFMNEQQFEMVLFVDYQRIMETEQASIPFNWRWDLREIPPGRHDLTINLVSVAQHVATYTVPVEIRKGQPQTRPAQGSLPAGRPTAAR